MASDETLGDAGATADAQTQPDPLEQVRRDYPGHWISEEAIGDEVRYTGRAASLRINPHTVITTDLAELRAALKDGYG